MEFTALIPIFSSIIERLFPDPVAQEQAKTQMQTALNQAQASAEQAEASEMASQAEVIKSETESKSWLASNWRPTLMFLIILLIANQWVISPVLIPILSYFHLTYALPAFPDNAWNLLTVGLGGYIGKEAVIAHQQGKLAVAQASNAPTLTSKIFFDALRDVKGSALTDNEVADTNKVLSKLGIS